MTQFALERFVLNEQLSAFVRGPCATCSQRYTQASPLETLLVTCAACLNTIVDVIRNRFRLIGCSNDVGCTSTSTFYINYFDDFCSMRPSTSTVFSNIHWFGWFKLDECVAYTMHCLATTLLKCAFGCAIWLWIITRCNAKDNLWISRIFSK